MSIMAKTPSGYKKIGSAYLGERPVDKVFNANGDVVYALQRELTGVPPLLFKGKEQSELLNYRIYGDTVDGESVGDRTANLIQGSIKNANIGNGGKINTSNEFILVYAPVVTGESYTISNNNGTNVYAFYNAVPSTETATSYDSNRQIFSTSTITFVSPITGYIAVRLANTAQDIMINPGSTALPYEPYGHKVPVTVEGKNLLQNTATSTTKNGVTFTVNSDGSVTCNGTADKVTWFDINRSFDVYSPDGRIASIGNQGSLDTFYMNIGVAGIGNVINSHKYSKTTHNNCYIHIVIASGYTCDNLTLYPMIRLASIEDDTYEPYHAPVTTPIYLPEPIKMVGDEAEYIDYGEQKQHRVRKNLLISSISEIRNTGVEYTVNNDKSITANGSTSSIFSLALVKIYLTKGSYIISGCPQNGSQNTYRCEIRDKELSSLIQDTGTGVTYSIVTDGYYYYSIRIAQNYVCDNLTFYPMIRKADIEDDTYEPYIENVDLDVTLPALPTIKGTNTMSIDTTVQPSRMDIKGRIKTLT